MQALDIVVPDVVNAACVETKPVLVSGWLRSHSISALHLRVCRGSVLARGTSDPASATTSGRPR
jgi:hypothetical protein